MNLDKLLVRATTKAQLEKAFEHTRTDLLVMTLRRMVNPETIESEIQKSVDEFIANQQELDEISRFISSEIAQEAKQEIIENLINPDSHEVKAYSLTIPR